MICILHVCVNSAVQIGFCVCLGGVVVSLGIAQLQVADSVDFLLNFRLKVLDLTLVRKLSRLSRPLHLLTGVIVLSFLAYGLLRHHFLKFINISLNLHHNLLVLLWRTILSHRERSLLAALLTDDFIASRSQRCPLVERLIEISCAFQAIP